MSIPPPQSGSPGPQGPGPFWGAAASRVPLHRPLRRPGPVPFGARRTCSGAVGVGADAPATSHIPTPASNTNVCLVRLTYCASSDRGKGPHSPSPSSPTHRTRNSWLCLYGMNTKGGGGGALGGSHKGAAYSNLIIPQPILGQDFLWVGGSQSQKTPPPPLSYKQSLAHMPHRGELRSRCPAAPFVRSEPPPERSRCEAQSKPGAGGGGGGS